MTGGHRRCPLYVATGGIVVVAFVAALVAQQQYPVFSASNLDATMKTVGLAFDLAKRALAKGDVESAKDYLPRSREQLAPSVTFWRNSHKADAIVMLRTSLKAIDYLDATLSAARVDANAISLSVKHVEAACEACHAVYREQDPVTKAYRLKADVK